MPDAHREDIVKLESLYAEHPEGRIFTHLAEAYRKAGELDRAAEVLQEGLQRHPDYSSAHVVLGRVLADQGKSGEATAAFQRVLELDSHNLVALRGLGDLARGEGREADAIGYYARLLDVEPADDQVRQLMDSLTAEDAAQAAPPADSEADAGERAADEPWGTGLDAEASESEPWAASGEAAEEAEPWSAAAEEEPADPWAASGNEDREAEPWAALDDDDGTFEPWASLDESAEEEPAGHEGAADEDVADEGAEEMAGASTDLEAGDWSSPEQDVGSEHSADEWSETEQEDPPSMAPGVMTETIAQVYARQGLYDRAADVYRQLLRERPDDQELRFRLDEMEQLSSSQSSIEGLQSVDFDGADADTEPLPGLEATDADAEAGLSREPLPPQSQPEPWDADTSYDDWLPPGEGGLGPSDEEAGAEEDSVWVGGDWTDTTEDTPYAWTGSDAEAEEDSSPPIGSYFRSLLGWAPGAREEVEGDQEGEEGEEGQEGQEAVESADFGEPDEDERVNEVNPVYEVEQFDEGAGDSWASSESAPTETAEPTDPGADEDDDDLDTFRSWLENLRR